jgi:hypothetical protein
MSVQYADFLGKLPSAKDSGRYISGMCPFHDDRTTPSLLVWKDGWFNCLSSNCGRKGTWLTLWNKLSGQPVQIRPEKRTIYSAPMGLNEYIDLETLSYQAHMDLEHFPSWQWYLEMRKVSDSIGIAEIGYHRGWYTFPVYERERAFQTTVFRSAPHVQQSTNIRYWCKQKPVRYVPDWRLMEKPKFILVVFGIIDALTINKYRYPVITSTAGANTFKAEWLDEWRRPIYILPDKGDEKTAMLLAGKLGWRGNVVYLDYPEGCKDPNDMLVKGHEKKLQSELSRIDHR